MAALEPLCYVIGINPKKFSKEENKLLEAELFIKICNELREVFREQNKEFFNLMRLTTEQEDIMLENNFIQLLIKDILCTGEYTLQGVAQYTDTHEDVIHDLASGINTKPLAYCFRRIIELHRYVRIEIYKAIGKKISDQYSIQV